MTLFLETSLVVFSAEQSIATERRIGSVLKSSLFVRRRLNRIVRGIKDTLD